MPVDRDELGTCSPIGGRIRSSCHKVLSQCQQLYRETEEKQVHVQGRRDEPWVSAFVTRKVSYSYIRPKPLPPLDSFLFLDRLLKKSFHPFFFIESVCLPVWQELIEQYSLRHAGIVKASIAFIGGHPC